MYETFNIPFFIVIIIFVILSRSDDECEDEGYEENEEVEEVEDNADGYDKFLSISLISIILHFDLFSPRI